MLGLSVGLSEDEIAAMAAPEKCTSFDTTDCLVLEYAEMLTRENRVLDALYARLSEQFDKTELMELAGTIGLAAMVNRLHATFMTDLDGATVDAVGDAASCALRTT